LEICYVIRRNKDEIDPCYSFRCVAAENFGSDFNTTGALSDSILQNGCIQFAFCDKLHGIGNRIDATRYLP